MSITDHRGFCWGTTKEGQRMVHTIGRTGRTRGSPCFGWITGQDVRQGFPFHAPYRLARLPSRAVASGCEDGRKGRPTRENDPVHAPRDQSPQSRLRRVAVHRSPLPRALTCKGKMANGETFCSAFRRETKKLNKPSQTHTEVIAFLTAILLPEDLRYRRL